MTHINGFFSTYFSSKNITVTNAMLIFSALNKQKIIPFINAQF